MLWHYEQSSRQSAAAPALREISKDMEQNSEVHTRLHSVAFKTVLLRAAHYVAKTFSSQATANVFAAVLRNIDYVALLLQLI